MRRYQIRLEEPGDEETIFALTESAFRDMPFSDGDEQHLVNRLRSDGDLTLSMVAVEEDRIIGHIAFSPVTIRDQTEGWYGLGPVSVWPELQRKGTGGALIDFGIMEMREIGAKGIVLLGSNIYYPRFGFTHEPQLTYPSAPAEFFQCLLLDGELPSGEVKFSPAFG